MINHFSNNLIILKLIWSMKYIWFIYHHGVNSSIHLTSLSYHISTGRTITWKYTKKHFIIYSPVHLIQADKSSNYMWYQSLTFFQKCNAHSWKKFRKYKITWKKMKWLRDGWIWCHMYIKQYLSLLWYSPII